MDEPKYYTHTLSNGLRVALLPAKSHAVYCGFGILTGSRDDTPGNEGLAHMVEHMLFKGTQKRRALHINKRMELVGGELNAYTTKDETFFYAGAPRGELVRAMELLWDLVRHATFPEKELIKERTVVVDEINLYKDTPSDQIFDDWEELFFKGTDLEHPVLGSNESVMQITSEEMRQYLRNRFQPERMVFFCMGQVGEKRFLDLCQKYLSETFDLPDVSVDKRPSINLEKQPFCEVRESDTYQGHTLIGGVGYHLHDERRTEASVLMSILAGQSTNSLLNLNLREKHGWVYGVEGHTVAISDFGWWQIYFGSDPRHASRALDATLGVIAHLKSNPIKDSTLRAWKKQLIGQLAMSSESSEAIFLGFGRQFLHFGDYEGIPQATARVESVTSSSLHAVAEELFHPDNISRLILSGKSE